MLKSGLKKLIQLSGFDVVRYQEPAASPFPPDFEPRDIEILRAVAPYTMTSPERLFALVQAVRYVVQGDIPGALVECGVWRGGSVMAAALALLQMNREDRALYLFDTFEGMSSPDEQDVTLHGEAASAILQNPEHPRFRNVFAYATLDEVRANVQQTGYDQANIHFIQGKVEDTIPEQAPETIALLRLDTDWYESTKHELEYLFPRLSPHGVLIIDDYGHWRGCRRATDEYFARENLPILLNRIDYTGRIAVKQG
ncbi:MAG: macrocin O-methyltransferase [Chloroflexaceae bacterium]|nr:macrocin O-methyltransferase [Chloroflexaceae bacterium]